MDGLGWQLLYPKVGQGLGDSRNTSNDMKYYFPERI